jgi:glycosyltransferase involved in cell wall biosynthesis
MISSILFLGSQMAVGGAQRVLFTQAQWFHENGYRVTAAFFYDKEGLKSKWVSSYPFQVIDLRGRAGKATFFTNLFLFIGGFVRLMKLLKRNEVDVIETFTPDSNLLGIVAARLVGVPVRVASHHGYIEGAPRWRVRLHGWMVNHGYAQHLVAVSDRVRRIAIEEEGVRPELVSVILNGIQPVIQEKSRDDIWAAYQQEFSLNRGDFVYLSIGRLTVQKGHTYLLEAALKVVDHFDGHSVFLIAGEGHLREDLEKKAVQLGLQEAVYFLGNRDDIPELLSLADVFVLPSIWEGLPLALLEAMSAGLPVIATKVEGVENVVEDGENGILLPTKDVGALAEAMIKIRDNPETLRIIGKRNSDLVNDEFTIDRMCEQYEELFQQLYQQETGK